jgi:hypothetical protein
VKAKASHPLPKATPTPNSYGKVAFIGRPLNELPPTLSDKIITEQSIEAIHITNTEI